MTVISKILSFFPTFILLLTGAAIIYLAYSPNIFSILAVLLSIYGLPVLVYRLHEWVYPVREGISYLLGKEYNPWWGSHQIQVIYIAIPALEAVLRLIPGVFSCWLRLWGAKVGRDVYWTPGLEIADRSLLEIGDRVVVGHNVGIYCHIIKPRKQNLMLYVKKVKIGSNVFVGAGSNLAPGVIIADDSYLPAATKLYPNQKVQ
ncbi:acyl transferase [Nostoc sp. 'Peltigera membranacea cyanobiont' 213]|uniref:acyltransferase n=1 Tax=Nostoc cyanobionts TaxID=3123326 RepID=UPI000B95BCC9|nr:MULTISPECIES: DapH/DapD/GlmU-related protein [unclassified Nostoc]AVH64375.1 O-acetyltransferase [Nostoc sp. 'Peltigera membranacea cyanobiont' N6]OYD98572.1 acyl transferase [Nostoc sp. 'Peltigera membranacea cyanobiont' 213]